MPIFGVDIVVVLYKINNRECSSLGFNVPIAWYRRFKVHFVLRYVSQRTHSYPIVVALICFVVADFCPILFKAKNSVLALINKQD